MRDRRKPAAHISHERWLVSYADFVTLLFAFFVVLYASAQVDKQKAEDLSDAIKSGFQQLGVFQKGGRPGEDGSSLDSLPNDNNAESKVARLKLASIETPKTAHPGDFDGIRSELERALASEIKRNEVALHMEADGLVVSLREMGFFDSGSATIKPGAEGAVSRVAMILREHACAVRIEGHTDDVPIHTAQFASNWELSTARATELVKSLIEDHGVPAERLSAAGYAEFHPTAGNDTAKGRQLNRRVDLVILTSPGARPPANQVAADTGGLGAPSAGTAETSRPSTEQGQINR